MVRPSPMKHRRLPSTLVGMSSPRRSSEPAVVHKKGGRRIAHKMCSKKLNSLPRQRSCPDSSLPAEHSPVTRSLDRKRRISKPLSPPSTSLDSPNEYEVMDSGDSGEETSDDIRGTKSDSGVISDGSPVRSQQRPAAFPQYAEPKPKGSRGAVWKARLLKQANQLSPGTESATDSADQRAVVSGDEVGGRKDKEVDGASPPKGTWKSQKRHNSNIRSGTLPRGFGGLRHQRPSDVPFAAQVPVRRAVSSKDMVQDALVYANCSDLPSLSIDNRRNQIEQHQRIQSASSQHVSTLMKNFHRLSQQQFTSLQQQSRYAGVGVVASSADQNSSTANSDDDTDDDSGNQQAQCGDLAKPSTWSASSSSSPPLSHLTAPQSLPKRPILPQTSRRLSHLRTYTTFATDSDRYQKPVDQPDQQHPLSTAIL